MDHRNLAAPCPREGNCLACHPTRCLDCDLSNCESGARTRHELAGSAVHGSARIEPFQVFPDDHKVDDWGVLDWTLGNGRDVCWRTGRSPYGTQPRRLAPFLGGRIFGGREWGEHDAVRDARLIADRLGQGGAVAAQRREPNRLDRCLRASADAPPLEACPQC